MKRTRNPYSNTRKRMDALAWMAARGIDQPRGIGYRPDMDVKTSGGALVLFKTRKLRLI